MEKLTEDSDGLERYQQIDSKIGVMLHIEETEFRPSQDAVHSAVTDPSLLPRQVNMMRRLNTTKMVKNHSNHARRSPDQIMYLRCG